MRTLIIVVTTAATLVAGSLWAQETDPARQSADQWQAEQALRVEREQRLNELMSTMTEEMEAMHEAGNSSKRQQLLATHRAHMYEAMDLMRDLGGTHMREVSKEHLAPHHATHHSAGMGGTTGGHMMSAVPRDRVSDAVRLGDLETRVDMMQIMLESMLTEQADR
jgi:hypothetical protein